MNVYLWILLPNFLFPSKVTDYFLIQKYPLWIRCLFKDNLISVAHPLRIRWIKLSFHVCVCSTVQSMHNLNASDFFLHDCMTQRSLSMHKQHIHCVFPKLIKCTWNRYETHKKRLLFFFCGINFFCFFTYVPQIHDGLKKRRQKRFYEKVDINISLSSYI